MIALDGYKIIRRDRIGRRGGGVCIYISDQIFSEFTVNVIDHIDSGGIDSLFLKFVSKSFNLFWVVSTDPAPLFLLTIELCFNIFLS